MERETKEITLPVSNKVVVLKSYLIGREKRALTNIFFGKGLNVNLEGGVSGLDAASIEAAQELAWNTVIVSVDGKTDDIVNSILDLRSEDYQAVTEAVNAVTNDADFVKKNQA
jgi:hypothetical protein